MVERTHSETNYSEPAELLLKELEAAYWRQAGRDMVGETPNGDTTPKDTERSHA